MLELNGVAEEHGHPAAEVLELVRWIVTVLTYPVPNSQRHPSPKLVRTILMMLQERVAGLDSDPELALLEILGDLRVPLEFETGRAITVKYAERLTGDQVGTTKPDQFHRRAKVAVYCDSELHHSSRDARARDHGVSAALALRGITALRFTAHQILHQPKQVGAIILEHLKVKPLRKLDRDDKRRPDPA
jgi:hypothetical protein